MGLLDIKEDPDYVNANAATKQAIFDEYSKDDPDYQKANPATRDAIRKEFGVGSGVEDSTGSMPGAPQALTVGTAVAKELAPAAIPVAKDILGTAYNEGKGSVQDIGAMARVATNVTPAAAGDLIKKTLQSPVKMTSDLIGAYVQGHPYLGKVTQSSLASVSKDALNYAKNVGSALPSARNIGSAIVQGAVAPESLLAAPYQMAAYEQEKIRANPNAPEYATTPYAQQYRGEYATQGAAGAANRRNAIANQQYGGLTQEEQDILEQDRIRREIRRKAAEKALGPVAPRGM
jgi:hypothetical protein